MAAKRSRAVRSASQGEIGVVDRGFAPETLPAALFGNKRTAFFCAEKPLPKYEKPNKWASIKKEEPRLPVVFTVEPLERESVGSNSKKKNAGDGFGEFLEACSRCKKKLDENKDVFVYGYLGAFCSNYCRDKQIDIDGFNGEVSKDLAARLEAADSCNKR